ncbi:MAG: hypothetical protein CFE32_20755, partial [Alphaproteobacteria bacterium PA3]
MEPSKMSHDLSLAQNHAFQLARTLMIPVTLFKSGDAYGALPSNELDDGVVSPFGLPPEAQPASVSPATAAAARSVRD